MTAGGLNAAHRLHTHSTSDAGDRAVAGASEGYGGAAGASGEQTGERCGAVVAAMAVGTQAMKRFTVTEGVDRRAGEAGATIGALHAEVRKRAAGLAQPGRVRAHRRAVHQRATCTELASSGGGAGRAGISQWGAGGRPAVGTRDATEVLGAGQIRTRVEQAVGACGERGRARCHAVAQGAECAGPSTGRKHAGIDARAAGARAGCAAEIAEVTRATFER